MGKHTPGPWEYQQIKYQGYATIKSVATSSGKEIARITDDYGCVEEANARLIAAAPDLLEAAKHALICLRDHPDWHYGTFQELLLAIAKAEGKESSHTKQQKGTPNGKLKRVPETSNSILA